MYSKFRAEEVNSCSSSIANLEERYEGLIVSRVKAGWLCTIARTKSSCSGLSKEKFNSTNNLYSSGGTISSAEDVLVRTFLKFGVPCSSILPMAPFCRERFSFVPMADGSKSTVSSPGNSMEHSWLLTNSTVCGGNPSNSRLLSSRE